MNDAFAKLLREIPQLGVDWHRDTILANSRRNGPLATQSVRLLRRVRKPVLVISAGPSLYRQGVLQQLAKWHTEFVTVAIDGAYIQCLRAGIIPNYVMTLDPHPTRIVRWFGDPDFAKNSAGDDYFARQDLDEAFRTNALQTNAENIALIDQHRVHSKLIICCTAPENVVARTHAFDRYWFAPLVDNPHSVTSITREIAGETGLPSINTGGTVGTAAIIFAHTVLRAARIGVVGMDLGYYSDTPLERTQSWNMLKDNAERDSYYVTLNHPQWGPCYVDPTYFFYRQNLLQLLKSGGFTLHNCTGHGSLYGPHVECYGIDEWLASCS